MSLSHTLPEPRVTTVGDFFALLKPRVMSLVVFTGLAGIVAAPDAVHPLTAFTALLCIAVAAGASGCLNMAYDSDIDMLMSRTATRPIPLGHVGREPLRQHKGGDPVRQRQYLVHQSAPGANQHRQQQYT